MKRVRQDVSSAPAAAPARPASQVELWQKLLLNQELWTWVRLPDWFSLAQTCRLLRNEVATYITSPASAGHFWLWFDRYRPLICEDVSSATLRSIKDWDKFVKPTCDPELTHADFLLRVKQLLRDTSALVVGSSVLDYLDAARVEPAQSEKSANPVWLPTQTKPATCAHVLRKQSTTMDYLKFPIEKRRERGTRLSFTPSREDIVLDVPSNYEHKEDECGLWRSNDLDVVMAASTETFRLLGKLSEETGVCFAASMDTIQQSFVKTEWPEKGLIEPFTEFMKACSIDAKGLDPSGVLHRPCVRIALPLGHCTIKTDDHSFRYDSHTRCCCRKVDIILANCKPGDEWQWVTEHFDLSVCKVAVRMGSSSSYFCHSSGSTTAPFATHNSGAGRSALLATAETKMIVKNSRLYVAAPDDIVSRCSTLTPELFCARFSFACAVGQCSPSSWVNPPCKGGHNSDEAVLCGLEEDFPLGFPVCFRWESARPKVVTKNECTCISTITSRFALYNRRGYFIRIVPAAIAQQSRLLRNRLLSSLSYDRELFPFPDDFSQDE